MPEVRAAEICSPLDHTGYFLNPRRAKEPHTAADFIARSKGAREAQGEVELQVCFTNLHSVDGMTSIALLYTASKRLDAAPTLGSLSSWAVFGMSSCASFEQSAKMGDSGATILVKLDRADKMRTNARGEAPDPMAKFRIDVGACSLR